MLNLSQSLDQHPKTYYYNDKGESVGEGVEYLLNNGQVLRLFLRMVASQLREGKEIKILFVGTHR